MDIVEGTPTEAYERGKDEAADFIFHALGKALGFEDWTVSDGSETWDGDVCGTMYGILRGAGVMDPETDELATATISALRKRVEELEGALNWVEPAMHALTSYEKDCGEPLPEDRQIGKIDDSRNSASFRLYVGHIRRIDAALARIKEAT